MVLSTGKSSRIPALFPLLVLLFFSGCGRPVPVTGKVSVGDKPLTNGSVVFVPDKDKGNASTLEARGTIDSQGMYELTTNGAKGAPAGWYKVVIVASTSDAIPDIKNPGVPKSPIDIRYSSAKTTDLSVEVPAGPFDFKLAAASTTGSTGTIPMPK